ncbi:MAG TPA: response regulator transcription factor [Candidatus Limnocylindrales bacterium]
MPRRSASQPPAQPIRVMVVEPRVLVGAGVRGLIDREDDIEIVAQVRSPDEALHVVDASAPDVILVKSPSSERTDAEAARRLHRGLPDSPLVVLGGPDDASIVGAFAIGAVAHVAEVAQPTELIDTIRRVAEGEDPLKDVLVARPELVEQVLDSAREGILAEPAPANPLTPRETEILGLVAEGMRNKEIAARLDVSVQTVKNHMSGILRRLGARNRRDAVSYATRSGWLGEADAPA